MKGVVIVQNLGGRSSSEPRALLGNTSFPPRQKPSGCRAILHEKIGLHRVVTNGVRRSGQPRERGASGPQNGPLNPSPRDGMKLPDGGSAGTIPHQRGRLR